MYILLFVFLGPEMSQEERNEENALAQEYERMRAEGVSLKEIGAGRAKGMEIGSAAAPSQKADEKDAIRHVEQA